MFKRYKLAALGLFAAAAFIGLNHQQFQAWAAGMWSTLPIYGQSSFCASNVSGVGLPAGQGPYGVVPGSTQGTSSGICGQTVPAGPAVLTGTEGIPADAYLANQVTTGQSGGPFQTGVIPSGLLANMSGLPKNYLDNGSMNVQQYGTGVVTCAVASAGSTVSTYGPDRWTCDANVTSGAGRQQLVTTAALLPTGFANVNNLWRVSGSLAQPVCAIQEIPTNESTALAGKTVTLSLYATALAGLAADNNSLINGYVIYGTGAAQGLGTMTASPAITPAWTGIATLGGANVQISTTPTRYQMATVTIPATATEVGVEICFTPTTTSTGGATDGFGFTGVQLEVAPSMTAYEFHQYSYDLSRGQRYFYRVTETAAITPIANCASSTTSLVICYLQFPTTMAKIPTMSYAAGFAVSLIAQTSAVACTSIATSTAISSSAANVQGVPIACASSGGFTGNIGGVAAMMFSDNGSGVISAFSDF